MKLHTKKRVTSQRSEVKVLRREGNIPAIRYVQGQHSELLSVKAAEFNALLRKVTPGRLATSVFELVDEAGTLRKAIIKEISYHPVTYEVIHLDFEELLPGNKINVNIPIECINNSECLGVKQGGIVRQVIRSLRVQCLPEQMPSCFQVDVKSLGLWDSKQLKDIQLPEGVRPLANLSGVAITITKR